MDVMVSVLAKTTIFIFHRKMNFRVSELLLFNGNSATFQLFHGENKLMFIEMMMRSALDVMVSVLASGAVDHGFETRLRQIKDYEVGI
jgi:hypothetical protein